VFPSTLPCFSGLLPISTRPSPAPQAHWPLGVSGTISPTSEGDPRGRELHDSSIATSLAWHEAPTHAHLQKWCLLLTETSRGQGSVNMCGNHSPCTFANPSSLRRHSRCDEDIGQSHPGHPGWRWRAKCACPQCGGLKLDTKNVHTLIPRPVIFCGKVFADVIKGVGMDRYQG
jgi:hypothetical protein